MSVAIVTSCSFDFTASPPKVQPRYDLDLDASYAKVLKDIQQSKHCTYSAHIVKGIYFGDHFLYRKRGKRKEMGEREGRL